MNALKRHSFRIVLSLGVILSMLGVMISPATTTDASAAANLEVSGYTYTSPNYGFTVTWDANWFVVQEMTEMDGVVITDGLTTMLIAGGVMGAGLPPIVIAGEFGSFKRDPELSNVKVKNDANGNPMRGDEATRSWITFTYEVTADDGTKLELTAYLEARVLVEGEAVLELMAVMPSFGYDNEWPLVQQVLSSVTIPGQEPVTTGGTTETQGPIEGEPAPVFVSGPWRVAIAAAAQNAALGDLRLKEKDGKEWVVVVADVTNWSSEPAELNVKEFFLRPGHDEDNVKLAPSSTVSVAKKLDAEPVSEDLTVAFNADETKRVAFVFSIPERSRDIALVRETDALPLADALEVSLDPAEPPRAAVPPKVELGTLVSASDGKTIRIQLEGESKSTRMRLLGVEPPAEGECYENEAEKVLDDLAGAQVLVETDSAVDDGSTPSRYVWIINPDGSRTLINEQLVADGLATAERLPVDARFGAWIGESERLAETGEIGLWAGCEEPSQAPPPGDSDATPKAG